MSDLCELVGDDVPEDELERLERAHAQLLVAGQPPELPQRLAQAPRPPRDSATFLPQRRRLTLGLLAAALVAAAFGGGYYLAGREGSTAAPQIAFVTQMHGTSRAAGAFAAIRIQNQDRAGNWPMQLEVRGLHALPAGGYYELYLTRHGKPAASCGTFAVHGERTRIQLNAPYRLRSFDGWVVTEHRPGMTEDGPVVLRTAVV